MRAFGSFLVVACTVIYTTIEVARFVEGQPQAKPQVVQKFGWAGPKAAAASYNRIKATLPKFAIEGDERDDITKRACLWDAALALYGEHLKTLNQPAQDCVAASAAQAIHYLMAQAALRDGATTQVRYVFPPYHFACGRNAPECANGRWGRNPAGSTGVDQAQAIQLYGVIPEDLEGVPKYTADVTNSWAVRMPAAKWIEQGRLHVIKDRAKAETVEDVRRALQNYYPVTIASSWGGIDQNVPVVEVGGVKMRLNRRYGSWAHQMVVIGYQYCGGKQFFYVLNSWGPQRHGAPVNGEPPGGFWIGEADMRSIVSAGDSWVYSDVVGFPARDLPFRVFQGPKEKNRNAKPIKDDRGPRAGRRAVRDLCLQLAS